MRMFADANIEDQIPRRSAECTWRAVTRNAHLVAIAGARRDANGNFVPSTLQPEIQLRAAQRGDAIHAHLTGNVRPLHAGIRAAATAAAEQVAKEIADATRSGLAARRAEHVFHVHGAAGAPTRGIATAAPVRTGRRRVEAFAQ